MYEKLVVGLFALLLAFGADYAEGKSEFTPPG